jgi:hypothetical protein
MHFLKAPSVAKDWKRNRVEWAVCFVVGGPEREGDWRWVFADMLVAIDKASADGNGGIATFELLRQLGSTHHAKAFIKRAEREGLIQRIQGSSEHGHFRPIFNRLTPKGRRLLQSQFNRP